ncbi:VCBS domain-containing protein [Limnohabitans sp.]|uniref:beta strand repeat-containing protein n=1 Tax=Limnohabitans sp. TaxID=1907725 RepID=UPI0038B7F50E
MSEASRPQEKNVAVMASSADETMRFTSWALSKDGSGLPGVVPAPSQERIAVDVMAGQTTRVKALPGTSHAGVALQVQAKSPDKTAKTSHRQDQDDLNVTPPGGDELAQQNFDPYTPSASPALLSFNQPGDQAQVWVAQVESASVGAASAASLALLPTQDETKTPSAQEEKDDDKFWLFTFWGGTLVGVLPLLVLSGGFSGGSPNAGIGNVSPPNAPSIASVTDDVGSITGVVASGGRSDDTQLVVRVSLTGTGAVANDSVQLYDNTSAIAVAITLSSTNITNGWVDITTNTLSNATSYALNAKITDVAGNASAASGNDSVTIDTTAPTFTSASAESVVDTGAGVISTTALSTATATDASVVSYALVAPSVGDANLFNLNSTTGVLTFKTTEAYAASHDTGGDHVYNVTVRATDIAGNSSTQALTLTMTANAIYLQDMALGMGGFVINGASSGDVSGLSVSAAGDVNGDGLADVIIGAPNAWNGPANLAGRSFVVFGKTTFTAVDLSAIAAGTGGFVITGQSPQDTSGQSVSAAGDVNGDGLADVIVGADYSDPAALGNAGRSYVVFGKTTTTAVDLGAVAGGAGGFVINGQCAGDRSGMSVSSAGDVNGDGLADLVVGAGMSDPALLNDAGRSYVVFGKANTTSVDLSAVAAGVGGFVINGQCAFDLSGAKVSAAGDVNGDGFADVIVGAYPSDPAARADAGRSYVVFGKANTTAIDLSDVAAGAGGFVINGQSLGDNSGYAVSAAGDVNGDGLADVVLSAVSASTSAGALAGQSYVVFGKANTGAIDLSAVAAGNGGFVIKGQCAGDNSGASVSAAGDVNGDGLADVIVGAWLSDPVTGVDAGRSYVVYGKTNTSAIDLSAVAAGTGGFVVNGQCAGDNSGQSVSAAGDVNGDGLADVLVGAASSDPASGADAGRSYVIFGSTTGAFAQTAVDQVATSSNHTLTSTGNQTLVGSSGDDTLISSATTGADVLYGGAGNDTFVVGAAMVAALQSTFGAGGNTTQLARIDGGTGIDVLQLSSGSANAMANTAFDLTAVANAGANSSRLNSLEVVDLSADASLSAGKGNQLTLGLRDVLDMTGMNVFNSSNTSSSSGTALGASVAMHQLMVWGDATDYVTVNLGSWVKSLTQTAVTYHGHTLVAFDSNSAPVHAQLLIDQNIVNAAGHLTFVKDPSDTPVLSAPAAIGLTDTTAVDTFGNVTGTLSASFVDTGTPLTFGITGGVSGAYTVGAASYDLQKAGTYGSLYVNSSSGAYVFVANAGAVNAVAGASSPSESFTVRATDSNLTGTNTLNVTVTGADDPTVITGVSTANLTETNLAASLSTTGQLTASDVDSSAAFVAQTGVAGSNGYGQFSIDAGGAWTYTGNSAHNEFVGGQTYTDAITVATVDGTSQVITVTMTGTNDPAVFIGTVTGALTENSYPALIQNVLLRNTDVDNTTNRFVAVNAATLSTGGYGTYTIKQTAGQWKWSYTLDNSNATVQALNTGDVLTDTFTVYALDGTPQTITITINGNSGYILLSNIAAGIGGFVINGQTTDDTSGGSVSAAGDVNGDGLADVIVGANNADPAGLTNAGRSYVVFGTTSTTGIDLSAVAAGTGGFVINGQGSCDFSGTSVSSAGDINGDGLADLIVGAYRSDLGVVPDVGRSYVVFGKASGSPIDLSAVAAGVGGFVINGQCSNDYSGYSVKAAGDVNGDGLADVMVGAYQSDPGVVPVADAGRSYVVFGKASTGPIDLSAVAAGNGGFVINGLSTGAQSGYSVSAAGDVNGDGFADVIVGSPGTSPGTSYVVFGKANGNSIDVSDVAAGTGGFVINGQFAGDQSGYSVSAAGDVNGDGLADVVVGATYASVGTTTQVGRSYVVFGQTSTTAIDLSAVAAGTAGFVINGQENNDQTGFSVSMAGDVNGDGLADVIVSSRYQPTASAGAYNAGRSYVVYGKTSGGSMDLSAVALGLGGFVIDGQGNGDFSGTSVSAAGDVNGDGLADLLVGAYQADPASGQDAGRSYVIFGSTTGAFAQTAVDQVATSSNHTLTSAGNQTLVGSSGDDTLISSATTGADVLYGGAGNDTLVVSAALVAALQRTFGAGGNSTQLARIDGGTGIDVVQLASGTASTLGGLVDLTAIRNVGSGASRLNSVEVIDLSADASMSGGQGNQLKLGLGDVLDMTGMNVFNSGNTGSTSGTPLGASVATHQLMVWGDATDVVNIGLADWTKSVTNTAITYNGHTLVAYNYNTAGVYAQILIDQNIVNAGHVI